MFKSRTVFVVGAGASKELGLPIGAELIDDVAKRLRILFTDGIRMASGDPKIYEALNRRAQSEQTNVNKYREAAVRISDGVMLANSIDDFMDTHRHDPEVQLCGKLAIVRSILEAERRSVLWYDLQKARRPDLSKASNSWLIPFMRILRQGVPKESMGRVFHNVSMVVFNYDRCIEHFLFHALQQAYAITEAEALTVLGSLRIIHPYGTVGTLAYNPFGPASGDVPFGASEFGVDLLRVAGNIKTYTEQADEHDQKLGTIKAEIEQAQIVVFLGFAYYPQNMELLRIGPTENVRQVYGTALGLSKSDTEVVRNFIIDILGQYARMLPRQVELAQLSCKDLFLEYWRSLSMS